MTQCLPRCTGGHDDQAGPLKRCTTGRSWHTRASRARWDDNTTCWQRDSAHKHHSPAPTRLRHELDAHHCIAVPGSVLLHIHLLESSAVGARYDLPVAACNWLATSREPTPGANPVLHHGPSPLQTGMRQMKRVQAPVPLTCHLRLQLQSSSACTGHCRAVLVPRPTHGSASSSMRSTSCCGLRPITAAFTA